MACLPKLAGCHVQITLRGPQDAESRETLSSCYGSTTFLPKNLHAANHPEPDKAHRKLDAHKG